MWRLMGMPMASKNYVIGVLLVWASSATLFAITRRASSTFIPVCAEEQIRKPYMIASADENSIAAGLVNSSASPKGSKVTEPTQMSSSSFIHGIPEHLLKYVQEVFQPKVDVDLEEFTMIMLTYKRVKMLSRLILHYCNAKKLQKIIVVWNDVDSEIPHHILELNKSCQARLEFVRERENKLTNRFKPRPEIETDCKLLVCMQL